MNGDGDYHDTMSNAARDGKVTIQSSASVVTEPSPLGSGKTKKGRANTLP
jgi:hypothetical protein